MKKKSYAKLLLSSIAIAVAAPAALANVTSMTINAEVEEFVVLQIETNGGTIVSGDDLDPVAGSPAANEILDFGTVDSFCNSAGTLTATNGPASGTLGCSLLVGTTIEDAATYTGPMTNADGALYHINNGYQLRALRNDGTPDMDVDVEITGATALDAVFDLDAANDFSDGSTIGTATRRTAGGGNTPLTTGMALNTPIPVDLGVFVPVSQAAGATSTVITLTGT